MARRSARTHAAFLLPHLRRGQRLLDCGCGPGTLTCDFARLLSPGHVTGVDHESSQLERGRALASRKALQNVAFEKGSIYELPFADRTFDVVFAHAVFEHLSSSDLALAELRRVLVPGGTGALRSPDWGGFIIAPDTPGLARAIALYRELQTANGGDVLIGRKLPALVRRAGLTVKSFSACYECYDSPNLIGEYLACQLDRAGSEDAATALREWSKHPDAIFAQAWCETLYTT